MRTLLLLCLTATTTVSLAACEADQAASATGPDVLVETIGDTTVVRTLSGSIWEGEATLVPEVSIGELDGPEELLFGSIWSIAVDDDHNVYVFDGRTYVRTSALGRDDIDMHIIVFGPEGTQIDTLPVPSDTYEPPLLEARQGGISASYHVPFSPELLWTVHPSGRFLTGLSSDYRIDLTRDDGVLRVERAADPVPVDDEERAYERAGVVEDWREPLRYDVFEPDGTYLGVVAPPDDFSPWVEPVFDGDYVWAVTRDELGIQRVARFRIVVGAG